MDAIPKEMPVGLLALEWRHVGLEAGRVTVVQAEPGGIRDDVVDLGEGIEAHDVDAGQRRPQLCQRGIEALLEAEAQRRGRTKDVNTGGHRSYCAYRGRDCDVRRIPHQELAGPGKVEDLDVLGDRADRGADDAGLGEL